MSKWYEVSITAHKVVVVEVEDDQYEDVAMDFARMECGIDYSCIAESEARELTTEQQIDCAKRHADQVEPL